MIIKENTLRAEDGKILTNGDTYGKIVYLGRNDNSENWREISEEEYSEMSGQVE